MAHIHSNMENSLMLIFHTEKKIIKNSIAEFFSPLIKINELSNLIFSSIYSKKHTTSKTPPSNLHQKDFFTYEDNTFPISSRIEKLIGNKLKLLSVSLYHDNTITSSAAEFGLASIEVALRSIAKNYDTPPHLFGINRGGAFLVSYLAHRLDIHEKFLVKYDYRVDYEKKIYEERKINGPVVIIDDVSRTGKTIKVVKEHLAEKYPDSEIYTLTLARVVNDFSSHKLSINFDIIDYSPLITRDKDVTLPWSSKEKDAELIVDDFFSDVEMDQVSGFLIGNKCP